MVTIEPLFFLVGHRSSWRFGSLLLGRDHLPHAQIVQLLELMRGSWRDDFPVRARWNTVIAGVVFQHPSIEALIRELARNPALLQAFGFEVLPGTEEVAGGAGSA